MRLVPTSFSEVAGDNILREFTVTDVNGDPASLAGTTIRVAAALRPGLPSVFSTEDSPPTATIVETDLPGGIFRLSVAGSVTAGLHGTHEWQCEIEGAGGEVETVAGGYVTFERSLV